MSFGLYTTLLLIFTGILKYQNVQGANILAVFINGHQSHLLVYTAVVNLMIERGHNITLITTLDVKSLIDVKKIKWLQLSENYTETVLSRSSHITGLDKIERMLDRIENTSKFMTDPQWQRFLKEDNQYDLLILGYLFNDYQLGLGAHFKCPVVLIWTGQPIGFIQSLMGNPEERQYVPQPYDRHQYKGVQGIAFGWFEKFVEFLALEKMKEIYDKHFPSSHYPPFKAIRKSVSLVLCNHHSLSEGPIAPYLPIIIEIGGIENKFSKQENKFNLNTLITNRTDIIYISFGSRVKWSLLPVSLEQSFIKAFREFPSYTILWTYDKNCSELEQHFPSLNVKCNAWWPQSSILASPNTKLFITHGGKGSIAESQLYGKPMLGLAFFGDQKPNVDKMVKKGFGLKLDLGNITYENVLFSMRDILNQNFYKENIETFSKLYQDRPMSSEDNAIYWLEYVLRHKGAKHLQSPRLQLSLWEYYLMDIYGFIFLSFGVLTWSLNRLEKNLKRHC
ncbi:UDP-glycosyltransferase family 307 member A1 [Cochliomyia hominivorax]